MNQPDGNSLDERSRAISAALNIQRRTLFARVVHKADEPRSFPRSVTMRVLIRKPALLTRLLPVLMSTRRLGVVASLLAIAGLVQVFHRANPRAPDAMK